MAGLTSGASRAGTLGLGQGNLRLRFQGQSGRGSAGGYSGFHDLPPDGQVIDQPVQQPALGHRLDRADPGKHDVPLNPALLGTGLSAADQGFRVEPRCFRQPPRAADLLAHDPDRIHGHAIGSGVEGHFPCHREVLHAGGDLGVGKHRRGGGSGSRSSGLALEGREGLLVGVRQRGRFRERENRLLGSGPGKHRTATRAGLRGDRGRRGRCGEHGEADQHASP